MLLRVLLSIALILNGSGYAMAAPHMQTHTEDAPATAPDLTEKPMVEARPPCHAHQGAAPVATQLRNADSEGELNVGKCGISPSNCCESEACRCDCVQAPMAIQSYWLGGTVTGHAGIVHALQRGHSSPALPHLIRPPIG